MKGKLIVISGPSGVGKSTIRSRLINECDNFWYSISMTTREPRCGEVDGVDYYFVSKDCFLENINNNNLLEYAEVYNDIFYGTPKDKVFEMLDKGINVVLEIDVVGAFNVKKNCSDAILIFIAPPSIDALEKRLRLRNTDSEEKIIERINKAKYELSFKDKYDYIVINDDVDKCLEELKNIVK